MADPALLKQIEVKSGIVRRYVKEYHYYERESQKQADKIQQMRETPDTDDYVIKKAGEVLQETRSMIPITGANVRKSAVELQQLVDSNTESLKDTNQLATALQELASAEGIGSG